MDSEASSGDHDREAHPGSEVLCILHDPFKGTILTAGNSAVIKVWHCLTYELIGQHVGHAEAVTCLTLDANFLFSGALPLSLRASQLFARPTR